MNRLRVGFYAPMSLQHFAGNAVRVTELAAGLRQLGVDVTAIIPAGGLTEITRRFAPYETFRIPTFRNPFLRYAALSTYTQYFVPRMVFGLSFDILQIEGAYALPLSTIRRIARRRNVVFDMHSIAALDLEPYLPRALRQPLGRVIHASQDFLCRESECLVVSNCMKQYIVNRLGINPDRIHIIANGVNLDTAKQAISQRGIRYERIREGCDFLLAYAGGLEWYEGVDLMIEALAVLKPEIPGIRFVIAGKGTEEDSLKHQVSRLNLQGNVLFLGWIPYEDTFALQSVADVLVAPRRPLRRNGIDISTPMKIPSYLAAGRPIVASGIGEIPYVARHMKESLLVKRPVPDEFASAVLKLWGDPGLRRHLSEGCRARVGTFSWKHIARQLYDVYASMGR